MLRTFNWEMFRNERGVCGSRCSSISVSGKEKAVEKLVWFSGESPEGRRDVDSLEGPPYWEGSLDFAAWASFASMLRKTGRVVGEVGLSSGCIMWRGGRWGRVYEQACWRRQSVLAGSLLLEKSMLSNDEACSVEAQRMPFDLSSLNKGTSCRRSFCSGRLKSSFKNISVPLSFFRADMTAVFVTLFFVRTRRGRGRGDTDAGIDLSFAGVWGWGPSLMASSTSSSAIFASSLLWRILKKTSLGFSSSVFHPSHHKVGF